MSRWLGYDARTFAPFVRINPMLDRFNANFFFTMGRYLEEMVAQVSKDRINHLDLSLAMGHAEVYLEILYTEKHTSSIPTPISLKTSALAGQRLMGELADLYKRLRVSKLDEPLDKTDVERLIKSINEFSVVFGADLARAHTYVVRRIGVLDAESLIDQADDVFEGYKERIPASVKHDTNEAGRAMAFNLPTAAGFHIARATEGILTQYLNAWGKTVEKESQRNWGQYTKLLKTTAANKKVVNTIDQIRELHRNPLLHPEETLTMPEALSFWAICCSAIQGMVADMEPKQSAPKAEIVAMLPPDDMEES